MTWRYRNRPQRAQQAHQAGTAAGQATESAVVAGPNRVLPVRRSAENLPYLVALAVAPLINLAISINSFHHFHTLSQQPLPINHWIFSLSEFVLGGILLLFTINVLRTFLLGHHQIRTTLFAFGILSTLDLLLNLVTITTAIYSFKLGSFYLLLIALGLYCSLNLIFLFWYWFIDYPGQVRHLHHPDHLCQIIFPGSSQRQWALATGLPGLCLFHRDDQQHPGPPGESFARGQAGEAAPVAPLHLDAGAAGDRDLPGREHAELMMRGHQP